MRRSVFLRDATKMLHFGPQCITFWGRGLLVLQANGGKVGESEEKLESPSFLGSSKAMDDAVVFVVVIVVEGGERGVRCRILCCIVWSDFLVDEYRRDGRIGTELGRRGGI